MMEDIRQEIAWLKEEIADDEGLRGTTSFRDIEDRLRANNEKLKELLESYPELNES